eukprot:6187170-Pleurochrysis_carterae.AAC.1
MQTYAKAYECAWEVGPRAWARALARVRASTSMHVGACRRVTHHQPSRASARRACSMCSTSALSMAVDGVSSPSSSRSG